MSKATNAGKLFERLVAAIHKAADKDASVVWNDVIEGRQFDVTIRFKKGFYEYLTVIECKYYERPVPIEKVEAFITKARDVHANSIVMASTSGFQSGAENVARKHNVKLIHISPDCSEFDFASFGATCVGETPVLKITDVVLEYRDGEKTQLPEQSNALTYYANKLIIRSGVSAFSLGDEMSTHSAAFYSLVMKGNTDHTINCPAGTSVIAPDDGEIPLKPLAAIHVRVTLEQAKILDGPVVFDPYLFVPDIKVRDVETGKEEAFNQSSLPFGIGNVFKEGTFYEQPQLANYFYCHRMSGNTVSLYLIESYQMGQLFQAELNVPTEAAEWYVPVTDDAVLRRLQRRLVDFQRLL